MFEVTVSGKASDWREAQGEAVGYAGFFTLTYRGFMGNNKEDKTFLVLVADRQVEFAKKQAEKGYTLIVKANGMRAWVDKAGDVRLALEKVDLIIP